MSEEPTVDELKGLLETAEAALRSKEFPIVGSPPPKRGEIDQLAQRVIDLREAIAKKGGEGDA